MLLHRVTDTMSFRHASLNLQINRNLWRRMLCFSYNSLIWKRGYATKRISLLPPDLISLESSTDMDSARNWAETFKSLQIPREAVDISFSRSSGPGGQNVNKVNTKSTVKCPLSVPWIPKWARKTLRDSSAYVASADSILITSTLHRSQALNVDDCLRKLHSLVLSASMASVKNEASPEQKQRVLMHQKAEKRRRRIEKDKMSSIKQSRKKGGWD